MAASIGLRMCDRHFTIAKSRLDATMEQSMIKLFAAIQPADYGNHLSVKEAGSVAVGSVPFTGMKANVATGCYCKCLHAQHPQSLIASPTRVHYRFDTGWAAAFWVPSVQCRVSATRLDIVTPHNSGTDALPIGRFMHLVDELRYCSNALQDMFDLLFVFDCRCPICAGLSFLQTVVY